MSSQLKLRRNCPPSRLLQVHESIAPVVNKVLQAHEGGAVQAVVLRRGVPVSIQLHPHAWAGRGLLGCLLRPL
eukprot:1159402-Pelagomonas_calceolata.AAC.1